MVQPRRQSGEVGRRGPQGRPLPRSANSYRKARVELPGLALDFPRHVARIFGDGRLRHTNWVQAVAYSNDGKRLLSASQDATVKIWDAATHRELRTYTGHTEMVRSAAFSPDGKLVASAGGDKDIRLWDPETGKDVRTLQGHTEFINSVAFSPDGKFLVSGGADRKVRLHEVATGKLLHEFAATICSSRPSPTVPMASSSLRPVPTRSSAFTTPTRVPTSWPFRHTAATSLASPSAPIANS